MVIATLVVWALVGGLVALVTVTIIANPPTPGVETPVILYLQSVPLGWIAGLLLASVLFRSVRSATWGRLFADRS